MAARWAESSVTDCAIVAAGDSADEAEGDGVALGSAPKVIVPTHTKTISAATVVAVLDLKHRI